MEDKFKIKDVENNTIAIIDLSKIISISSCTESKGELTIQFEGTIKPISYFVGSEFKAIEIIKEIYIMI